jgi:hypothetical protein
MFAAILMRRGITNPRQSRECGALTKSIGH